MRCCVRGLMWLFQIVLCNLGELRCIMWAEASHCPRTVVPGVGAGLMWVMDRCWDKGATGLGALRKPGHPFTQTCDLVPATVHIR